MNISKINTRFMALMLGFAVVFGFSAFQNANNSPQSYAYKLNSSNPNQYQNPQNWEVANNNSPICNNGEELPCRVSYDGDFDAFVQTADLQALLDISTATKN